MPSARRVAAAAALLAALLVASPAAAGERKKGGGLSFEPFSTLAATVMRPDGRRGVITAEAGVDVPDAALKAKVDLLRPRLRDAYISVLNAFAAATPPGGVPDVDLLADRMQAVTDRIVGRPGAKLLIGAVIVN